MDRVLFSDAMLLYQILNPRFLNSGGVVDVVVVDVGVEYLVAIEIDANAALRVIGRDREIRVIRLLRAVYGLAITAVVLVGAVDIGNDGNGNERPGSGRLIGGDHGIDLSAGSGRSHAAATNKV